MWARYCTVQVLLSFLGFYKETKPLLVAGFATLSLMWHLLKMQSNASPSEESVALWITWMHRDNPPCKMQYMDYASQELHITRCKGPALLCNMQCIQDALQEAWITRCMWLVPLARLQGASGRLGLPGCGGVEYWVVGGGGGGWGDFDQ